MSLGISNSNVQTVASFCVTPKAGVSAFFSTFHIGIVAFEDLKEDEYLSVGIFAKLAPAVEPQSV